MLKGLDRTHKVAARGTGVAFLNHLLRGCDLLGIYVCYDGLIDRDLRQLPVHLIGPNPRQPRKEFDEESLIALAGSLGDRGVLQPVLVRVGKCCDNRCHRNRRVVHLKQLTRGVRDRSEQMGTRESCVKVLPGDNFLNLRLSIFA